MYRPQQRQGQRQVPGFTLIELLVVVAIIALLISILLPSLSAAKESARLAVCASNEHQLALATSYYIDEEGGRLPFIRGSEVTNYINAPYKQFDQLLLFWPYLKDLSIFRCPSAMNDTSAKSFFGRADQAASPGQPDAAISLYFVRKSDDHYYNTAFKNGWWPAQNPFDISTEEFPELYTEYWFNDFHPDVRGLLPPGTAPGVINDAAGVPIPYISGGVAGRIPFPNYTPIIGEFSWWFDAKQMRHNGGINLGFLDGHAAKYSKAKFYSFGGQASDSHPAQDWDPWGSRPFWTWGLTKYGKDRG